MMFSDNYTSHERYSVLNGVTRLSDYSEMPWLYTPLVDSRYKPDNISSDVAERLNNVLCYDYEFNDVEAVKDEVKHLGIHHIGSDIDSYKTRFRLRYSTWKAERGSFIRKTQSSGTIDLYDKMHEVVTATNVGMTAFIGTEHDVDGYITGLTVVDNKYNLESYNNPLLEKVSFYSEFQPNFCRGTLTVRPDNVVSFNSEFVYNKKIVTIPREEYRKNPRAAFDKKYTKKLSYRQSLVKHLYGYKMYDIITEDQMRAILELNPDSTYDAMVQIEHVFCGSELIDVIAHVVKYRMFEEIEVAKPWVINTDDDGNRIW